MTRLRPYHFVRLRATDFGPYYAAIVAADGVACFDWEDSIQALGDDDKTLLLKQEQRCAVRQLLAQPYISTGRVAVRINAPDSVHYAADLRALRGLPGLHAVFVPKVAHPDTLRRVLRELPLPVRHVVPIIETVAALVGLPALLAVADPRLEIWAFGHCDYNLSQGLFPFIHHDQAQYWEWIGELNAHLQAAGKRLLNSPVLQLNDDGLFGTVLQRLRAYPSAAGQITLCLRQTRACAGAAATGPAALLAAPGPACARQLAQQFEQHRLAGRFFALDAGRRLISPHEYAAARRQAPDSPCT